MVGSEESSQMRCGKENDLAAVAEMSARNRDISSGSGDQMAEDRDFPDLTGFTNQSTEDELDKLYADRFSMRNALYAEVATGIPDPPIIMPWCRKQERRHMLVLIDLVLSHFRGSSQHHPWNRDRWWDSANQMRNRGGWVTGSNAYTETNSRKRRNPEMDRDRMVYPGR